MSCHEELIFQLIKKNNGFVTAKEVTDEGIPRRCLTKLAEEEKIYKVERGIYSLPEVWEDELFFLQYRFAKGIFSHETALYLHGFTDRTPSDYTMTFPFGYNTSGVKKHGIIAKTSTNENYLLGVCQVKSPSGNTIRVYDIERTLCDVVKETHQTDIQIINQAMKTYAGSRSKDIAKLMKYAEQLRVKPKVLKYMEILL